MLNFSLGKSALKKMSAEPKLVQAAICVIANQQFDPNFSNPQAIGKCEGGVRVNNQEICIRRDNVMDDWAFVTHGSTPEEEAVVYAITKVAELVKDEGVKTLNTYVEKSAVQKMVGNPLRSFFEPVLKV